MTGPAATADKKPLLLCLSHLRWGFVWQRPQHLMTRAQQRFDVRFCEEPVWEDRDRPELRRHLQPSGVTVLVPHLPHGIPTEAVAELLRAEVGPGNLVDLLWYYTPMACAWAEGITAAVTVYDCMDELSAFLGAPPGLLEAEAALLNDADLVFTGGRSLQEAKRVRRPDAVCFPSSVDIAHFGQARTGLAEPADQATLPHPRLGYFGVIDERMDLDLVAGIAARRPDWSLVMVGPVVKIDPARLPREPNLHWLGGRPYETLPAYLSGWDVALIPFALNEATRFISPTKTPEYLAGGVRVVSTPIHDVVVDWASRDLVGVGHGADGTLAAVELALRATNREAWLAMVDSELTKTSWDSTWAAIDQAIMAARSE